MIRRHRFTEYVAETTFDVMFASLAYFISGQAFSLSRDIIRIDISTALYWR